MHLENSIFPLDPQIVKWPIDEILWICFDSEGDKWFPIQHSHVSYFSSVFGWGLLESSDNFLKLIMTVVLKKKKKKAQKTLLHCTTQVCST